MGNCLRLSDFALIPPIGPLLSQVMPARRARSWQTARDATFLFMRFIQTLRSLWSHPNGRNTAWHITSSKQLAEIANKAKPGLLILCPRASPGCDQARTAECREAGSEEQLLKE